jgi:uroporphyrinogen-III decarboxylase
MIDSVRATAPAESRENHRLCQGRWNSAEGLSPEQPVLMRSVSTGRCRSSFAAELQKDGPVQGNLDPMRVVAGGKSLDDGIDAILQKLGNGPLIFNLGHGITPQANPDHVRCWSPVFAGRA